MACIKHRCPMCDFAAPKVKFEKHINEVHNLTLSNYLWYYYFKNPNKPICQICGKEIILDRFDRNKKTCGNPSCVSTLSVITSKENGTFNDKIAGLSLTSEQRSASIKSAWDNPNSKLNSKEYRKTLSETMSNTMNSIWNDQESRVILSAKQYLGLHYEGRIYLYKGLIDNKIKIGITKDIDRRSKVEFFNGTCDSYEVIKKFDTLIEGVFAEAYIHLNYGIQGSELIDQNKLTEIYNFIDSYKLCEYVSSDLYKAIVN